MKIKITDKTRLAEIEALLPVIDAESKNNIEAFAVSKKIGNWFLLDLQTFTDYCAGRFGDLATSGLAVDYFYLRSFRKFVDKFIKILKGFEIPDFLMSQTEKNVAQHLPKMTMSEEIMTFCRRMFGLRRYQDIETLTVFDYVIARKEQYSHDLAIAWSNYYARKEAEKQMERMKNNSNRRRR